MAEDTSNVLHYVARVLRDQLEDFLSGNAEAPGLRTTLNLAAQQILVSEGTLQTLGSRKSRRVAANELMLPPGHPWNEDLINANVWHALPPQLLHLVFAHLPVPEIQRLRVLSKEWRQSLEDPSSEFRRVCAAEECSSRFAVICPGDMDGKFSVNTFDLRTTQWQTFEYRAPPCRWSVTICACAGGLVCILYKSMEMWLAEQRGPPRVCMSVWNPVTGGEVRLPLLPVSDFSQCAAKLYVNRQTNSFRVLFVTIMKGNRGGRIRAHVFDSVAWEWETAEKSSTPILCTSHRCAGPVRRTGHFDLLLGGTRNPLDGILAGFCFYDSAAGVFKSRPSEYTSTCVKTVACTEDHCFYLLQKGRASEYKIFEYDSGGQVYNKCYRCPSPAEFPQGECKVKLQACETLLILEAHSHQQQQRRWLLDLSTGKWRDLPDLPEDKTSSHVEYVLCELQWNVCPKSIYRTVTAGKVSMS